MTDNINIGGISRMHTSPELSGLVDGIDFPHSGLFKSLSSAVQGNYAIINSATSTTTNFGITQTGTSTTTLNVSTGQVMRDGKLMPAVTLASTPFVVGAQDASNIAHFDYRSAAKGGGNSYYLLVVDASNVIQMRHNGAPPDGANSNVVDIIPQLTAGDIPIAVVRLAETDAVTGRLIQYLTTAKEENSLSIGYDNTGYVETGTIQGLATGTTVTNSVGDFVIENTAIDKDIIIKGNDGGVATTIVTIDASLKQVIVPYKVTTNILSLGYGTGPAKIQTYNTGDNLQLYSAGDANGNVMILELDAGTDGVEANRIATVSGNLNVTKTVGIGTDTPLAPLHIKSTDDGTTLLLESTDSDAGLAPDLVFKRTSSTPVSGDNLGSIRFLGMNINDESGGTVAAEHEFADIYARGNDLTTGTEDGELYFRTFIGGTQRRRIDLTPIRTVFNEDGQDVDFRVESSSEANMLVVDAGINKVGIGTATPSEVLDVDGVVGMAGIKRKLVEANSATVAYILSITSDYTVWAETTTFNPAAPHLGGGPLNITVPAASTANVGHEYQLIIKGNAGGPDNLTITMTSSNTLCDEMQAGISTPFSLITGKIYKLLCVNATHWMLQTLN
tara:strand:+ start:1043 stop:2890 length:1848 start_codon:yes stop_codon:yes gene_type:complete